MGEDLVGGVAGVAVRSLRERWAGQHGVVDTLGEEELAGQPVAVGVGDEMDVNRPAAVPPGVDRAELAVAGAVGPLTAPEESFETVVGQTGVLVERAINGKGGHRPEFVVLIDRVPPSDCVCPGSAEG